MEGQGSIAPGHQSISSNSAALRLLPRIALSKMDSRHPVAAIFDPLAQGLLRARAEQLCFRSSVWQQVGVISEEEI